MNTQHKIVLDTFDTIKTTAEIQGSEFKRVLNIGYRPNSNPLAQQWCEANGVHFDVLEVFGRNVVWAKHARLKVHHMDVRELVTRPDLDIGQYDFVLWLHGPEHIHWSEFLEVRHCVEGLSTYGVIYQAPIGEHIVHPEYYGNPAEAHLESLWPFQFTSLGYTTVLHKSETENCFSAVRIKPCV